jgi:hypothetical protein
MGEQSKKRRRSHESETDGGDEATPTAQLSPERKPTIEQLNSYPNAVSIDSSLLSLETFPLRLAAASNTVPDCPAGRQPKDD